MARYAARSASGSVSLSPGREVGAIRVNRARLMPLLVAATILAVGAYLVDGYPVGVTNDDGMYVILAKALATGNGYRWIHLPGAPAATHFPPGYPAVLALLWWLVPAFPAKILVFKLANAFFMSLAAAGTYWFVRARLAMSEIAAVSLALAATLGIPMLTLSTIVMSEPLFLALLILTLVFAERVGDTEPGRRHRRDLLVLALLAACATLVRSQGVALVGAILLVLCLRRHFRRAAVFGSVTLVVLLPWQLWVSTHSSTVPLPMRGNYESYGAWFAAGLRAEGVGLLPRTVARTSGELAGMFEELTSPSAPDAVHVLALVALIMLSAAGARELWRRAPVTAAFLGFYLTIVFLWPFSPTRFVWGIWPLVMLLPVLGARAALLWRPSEPFRHVARFASLAAGVLLAGGYLTYNVRGYRHRWWSSIPRTVSRTASPLLLWIATHTPRDAVLATEVESAVYLYTGRPVVPVSTFTVDEYFTPRTPAQNADAIRGIVAYYRPKAVVVASGRMRDAVRELALGTPRLLAAVDTFPGGGVVLIPELR